MLFSSNLFVFAFVPIFFSLYFLLPFRFRNGFTLLASLFFYAFGAGPIVLVLVASILVNYAAALAIEKTSGKPQTAIFVAALAINLAGLFYYKYANFFWGVANTATHGWLSGMRFDQPHILLPIGISFFTFQAISYIADVYASTCRPARSLVDFGMYHSLFPQLIAGPIVRYVEIQENVRYRSTSIEAAASGATRFVYGLAKKLIIADTAGLVVDQIFGLSSQNLTPAIAWLGAASYAIEILFDFSGYSDMAIGLGILLGFKFPENFNQPYISQSVTEFWRRWHMTLSRWFRDYLYIPLGGNRYGTIRTYFNLVIVFFLCGLWHGAGVTFVVWGLYHGGLLVIERITSGLWNWRPRGFLGQIWTVLAVTVGWVFFRASDMSQASAFLNAMAFRVVPSQPQFSAINFLPPDRLFILCLGAVLALAPPFLNAAVTRWPHSVVAVRTSALLLFALSALVMSANTFNPFIYFRF